MRKYSNFYQNNSIHILNNLHLLGVTPQICYKQTKQTLEESSLSKLTYFIVYHSMKILTEEYSQFKNWYPPRTVADQGEFKKITLDLINRLQLVHKIPKSFIIDKKIFDDGQKCLKILRYLTQFALRQLYIDKYGDLVQVSLSPNEENIDRFYPQVLTQSCPFNEDLFQVFQTHIEMVKGQLIQKSTYQPFSLPFQFQELMTQIDYQNQIKDKLSKVPKQLFSENRELDRIQMIDKLAQIWRVLDLGVQQTDIGTNQFVQGQKQFMQIDVEWEGWLRKLVSAFKGLNKKRQEDQIKNPNKIQNLRKMLGQLKEDVKELRQFRQDVGSIVMQ